MDSCTRQRTDEKNVERQMFATLEQRDLRAALAAVRD